nr:reverse transcriptase domain-containing protein [Tanacetum cinerariifolium]
TLCFLNYALMIRQDYDITSSLRRVALHTSAVQNTLGKEQIPQDLDKPVFDAALREYCDRNYHQLLPILAEKVHQEKVQQEKLKAVKASLSFEEVSRHSELGTPSRKKDLKKGLDLDRLGDKGKSMSAYSNDSRRMSYHSSRGDTEKAATKNLAQEKQCLLLKNVITKEHPHEGWKRCQKVKILQEDTRS